ncbi:MAG: hypothetical protein U0531_20635 [Dehalococcoidia bacterium]
MRRVDALIHVVRAFDDPAVPHPEGSIDSPRDIATMDLELAFADLAVIERRLDRLEAELRSTKAGGRGRGARARAPRPAEERPSKGAAAPRPVGGRPAPGRRFSLPHPQTTARAAQRGRGRRRPPGSD